MVAGHAKQTAKRSLLEMSLNIIISVVLVQFIGIYGVLVGSFASLFYRANDMIIYTNIKKSLKENHGKNIRCGVQTYYLLQ